MISEFPLFIIQHFIYPALIQWTNWIQFIGLSEKKVLMATADKADWPAVYNSSKSIFCTWTGWKELSSYLVNAWVLVYNTRTFIGFSRMTACTAGVTKIWRILALSRCSLLSCVCAVFFQDREQLFYTLPLPVVFRVQRSWPRPGIPRYKGLLYVHFYHFDVMTTVAGTISYLGVVVANLNVTGMTSCAEWCFQACISRRLMGIHSDFGKRNLRTVLSSIIWEKCFTL